MAHNEPLEHVNELRQARDGDDDFPGYKDGYEDGRDDGYAADADETEGYEPETFEIARYEPPPQPWHRSPRAMISLGAIGLAAIAIVVSVAILVSRPSSGPPSIVSPTETTTTSETSSAEPSPSESPPPPPPGPTTAANLPVIAPTPRPGPTKRPEINVTRTPVTRTSMSASPSHPPRPQY